MTTRRYAPLPPITYSLPEVVATAAIGLAGLGIAAVVWFVGWRQPLPRAALVTGGVGLFAPVPLYWLPVSTFPANLLFVAGVIALAVGAVIELEGL